MDQRCVAFARWQAYAQCACCNGYYLNIRFYVLDHHPYLLLKMKKKVSCKKINRQWSEGLDFRLFQRQSKIIFFRMDKWTYWNIRCNKNKSLIFPIVGFSNLYMDNIGKTTSRTENSVTVLWLIDSVLFGHTAKADINKEKIREGRLKMWTVFIVHYAQLWFRRVLACNFDVHMWP